MVNVLILVQWVFLSGMVGFVCVCVCVCGGGTLRKDIVKLASIEASAGLQMAICTHTEWSGKSGADDHL